MSSQVGEQRIIKLLQYVTKATQDTSAALGGGGGGGLALDVSVDGLEGLTQTLIDLLDGTIVSPAATDAKLELMRLLLVEMDADTNAIKTAVEIIDNAISGNEMQVDIVTTVLATGAATEAKQNDIIADTAVIETNTTNINTNLVGGVSRVTTVFRTSATTPLIAVGAVSVSIANVGNADGTVTGAATILKKGEVISISPEHINDDLAAIVYNATGTEFLITTLT